MPDGTQLVRVAPEAPPGPQVESTPLTTTRQPILLEDSPSSTAAGKTTSQPQPTRSTPMAASVETGQRGPGAPTHGRPAQLPLCAPGSSVSWKVSPTVRGLTAFTLHGAGAFPGESSGPPFPLRLGLGTHRARPSQGPCSLQKGGGFQPSSPTVTGTSGWLTAVCVPLPGSLW